MPPKQQSVEDKTFGLKNRCKSKSVQKHVQSLQQTEQPKPDPSKIDTKVCKYFLEAMEKKQYGWIGVCPSGGKDCHYRHALPPGFVLKFQMKALIVEEAEKIAIEEEIEEQRSKLTKSTPMTPELFMEWKKKRTEEREAGLATQQAETAKMTE